MLLAWVGRSLAKSLTGGVIARLLATPELQFVAARMLRPSAALTDELLGEFKRAAAEDGVRPYSEASLRGVLSAVFVFCNARR